MMHDIYTKKQRDCESVCTCKIFNLSLSVVCCHSSSPKDQTRNTAHVTITVLYPYNQTRNQWRLFFSIYFGIYNLQHVQRTFWGLQRCLNPLCNSCFFYRNIQVSAETLSKDRTQIYLMYFDLLTGD